MTHPTPTSNLRPPLRILLVDDDPDDYLLTRDLVGELPGRGYTLDWVSEFDEARQLMARNQHDVYLVDYHLGAKTGLELIASQRDKSKSGPMILLTGQGQREIDRAAEEAGASDYLEKATLDAVTLERTIRYALRQFNQEAELERKVRERTIELANVNATLRETDRRKDEFLATLAHELRNPLAPIRNALEIQRMAATNPSAVETARQMIDRQVKLLVRLIDDLLDASRMTRDKLHLNLELLDLAEPVGLAIETTQPLFDGAGVKLTTHLLDEPLLLNADRVRLTQLIANVLNNAAKFSEPGGQVNLVVQKGSTEVGIAVRDEGVGIPADFLPHIFDLFTHHDRAQHRAQSGLGIGLALARRLVDMHGGTIHAKSEGLGKGAEFTIRLPLVQK